MGSVKHLIRDDSPAGKMYMRPERDEFGVGAWQVSGRFSVGDLKEQIPESSIKNKAEALAMMTGAFFEWFEDRYGHIPTTYLGLMDKNGKLTTAEELVSRGELSSIVVTQLAHTPESYFESLPKGQRLKAYREAMASGELLCGVADVESIFRNGFPLGSSTFEKIFKAAGMGEEYENMAKYDEVVMGLDRIRRKISDNGLSSYPNLEKILIQSSLGTHVPNPGFVLKEFVYNTTTKFEDAGDRDISPEEAKRLSGLDEGGYAYWTQEMFPDIARAQIRFCNERSVLNIDGKDECVAYKRRPVLTDFACTVDENRLMIVTNVDGVEWAIPSNKEIQRAIFREAGVYAAISEAKARAEKDGDINNWKAYFPKVIGERRIDLKAVTEHSCNLMEYAIAEVANRLLGKTLFDAKPVDSWVREFLPYASRVERQK